jgi:hypothetical protein
MKPSTKVPLNGIPGCRNQSAFMFSAKLLPVRRPPFVVPVLIAILACLTGSGLQAAQLNCSTLTPANLAGKTLWMTVSSGTAPYATSGAYRIELRADGSFTIPADGSQPPQTGTWSASVPGDTLVVRLKGFLGDATDDVLALFSGCLNGPACSTCGFGLTREGVAGLQQGDYTVTDGEAPAPATAPKVNLFTGGGTYPLGATAALTVHITGNPSSYRFKWFKNDSEIVGITQQFHFVTPLQASDAGLYRVEVSNAGGTVGLTTRISVTGAGAAPKYLDRPWTRVFGAETAIPRQPSLNGVFPSVRLAVRGGSIYALDGDQGNWLARSRNNTLTTLVAANDPIIDGSTIRSVSHFTADTNGLVVIYAQSSNGFGLFEVTDTGIRLITRVGLPTPAVGTTFTGFNSLTLRAGRLLFAGTDSQNKQGIYSWDGQTLSTVLPPDAELPGVLGTLHQVITLSFDGSVIALTANDGFLLNGNNRRGVFRGTLTGAWRELANVQTPVPSTPSQQLRQIHGADVAQGVVFFSTQSNLGPELYAGDASGRFHLVGPSHSADLVSAQFAAAGGQAVILRGGDQFIRIVEGFSERILGHGDVLDGRTVSEVRDVSAHGDDVAVWVGFSDGSRAIYAATGTGAAPLPPLQLGVPTLVEKALTFSLPTVAGTTYQVEVRSDLLSGSWSVLRSITGDGSTQTVNVGTDGSAGFVRVVAGQP